MAVIRVPFSAVRELSPPFALDEDYNGPNGVKSVLLDKSNVRVAARLETVSIPGIGDVELCLFYVLGTVSYICNAFPIVPNGTGFDVQQYNAAFDAQAPSYECAPVTQSDVLGWICASGCINVEERIGASCRTADMPSIESITIEDLAVANNAASGMSPTCENGCGEEDKRVVKWRGCLVITTTDV